MQQSHKIEEFKVTYDGAPSEMDVNCRLLVANTAKKCQVVFNFDKQVVGPLYVYYEITNFYQNHRRYVKSKSVRQLLGMESDMHNLVLDCSPLLFTSSSSSSNGSGKLLNPCGLHPNSFFNGRLLT